MHRRHLLGLSALAIAAPLTACGPRKPEPAPTPSTTVPAGMVLLGAGETKAELAQQPGKATEATGEAACTFAAWLAKSLDHDGDLLVSPTSLALPLAMLANGAKAESLSDLLSLLGFGSLDELNSQLGAVQQALASRNRKVESGQRSGEVALEVSNALWAQQATPVRKTFLEACARWYGSGVHGVDFTASQQAADAINDWAAERTNDRIKDLVTAEAITSETRLVVTNAIWFKAPWAEEFSRGEKLSFTHDDSTTTPVESFRASSKLWADGPGWQASVLDYLGGDLAMALVLPEEGKDEPLLDVWAAGGLHRMLTGWRRAQVRLTVPLWQHEQEIALQEPLRKMGVRHLFVGDSDVDLTGIRDEELAVTAAVQKTWISVDEKGTEAAAATALTVGATSVKEPEEQHELVLDRPFWYVIFDRQSATPLFLGRVAKP
ncbi:serpin family protein [Luteococcus sp. OSA5]|uniref:serpin family protein n=1 Tax=Luteococcus sp. OSA5 TaxID=3401630 RepID=UPI003B43BB90